MWAFLPFKIFFAEVGGREEEFTEWNFTNILILTDYSSENDPVSLLSLEQSSKLK